MATGGALPQPLMDEAASKTPTPRVGADINVPTPFYGTFERCGPRGHGPTNWCLVRSDGEGAPKARIFSFRRLASFRAPGESLVLERFRR